MISITGPLHLADLPSIETWGAFLRVQFSDAEYDAAMIARLRARGIKFDADAKGFPSQRSAEVLRRFIASLAARPEITELVVHCHAGQRRSAAVAKYACEQYSAPFDLSYSNYNKTVYALLKDPALFARSPSPLSRMLKRFGLFLR
ncbi:hypothetical protein [Ralstonia sp. ASV6]|uniref:hypothetical protein n=1 Tax=Ralstonia sp. ASV6 TaxID=2795124 RepID=UPI0018ECEC2A|nr:hypothetical protein [Ralstonia sp. ASV6]